VRQAGLPAAQAQNACEIPSFVDDSIFAEARDTPRPAFLPDGDFLLFVGALGEHKGMGLLTEAHRRMRAALPLVLIGSQRADTPVIQGNADRPVAVHTGVDHREIMAAFAAASVACVPSRWQEPLGLTAVEAMAAGTPVVATRVGALPEVVAHNETGLVVDPHDPQALADALDRLVADPHLRRRYGAAGRLRAARYTASAVLPRILDAYERAVTSRLVA
jgi:glycosyltransferase involved in cell wall biosynthesis